MNENNQRPIIQNLSSSTVFAITNYHNKLQYCTMNITQENPNRVSKLTKRHKILTAFDNSLSFESFILYISFNNIITVIF